MIRLLFTAGQDVSSWLIKAATKGRTSHVGIQVGLDEVIHASFGGVASISLTNFLAKHDFIGAYEAKPEIEAKLDIEALRSLIGSKYDYDSLIGAGLSLLSWSWFRHKIHNCFYSSNEFVCSSLALTLDSSGAIPEFSELNRTTVSPQDLLNALETGSSFKRLYNL